jgi:hypothetical protein
MSDRTRGFCLGVSTTLLMLVIWMAGTGVRLVVLR